VVPVKKARGGAPGRPREAGWRSKAELSGVAVDYAHSPDARLFDASGSTAIRKTRGPGAFRPHHLPSRLRRRGRLATRRPTHPHQKMRSAGWVEGGAVGAAARIMVIANQRQSRHRGSRSQSPRGSEAGAWQAERGSTAGIRARPIFRGRGRAYSGIRLPDRREGHRAGGPALCGENSGDAVLISRGRVTRTKRCRQPRSGQFPCRRRTAPEARPLVDRAFCRGGFRTRSARLSNPFEQAGVRHRRRSALVHAEGGPVEGVFTDCGAYRFARGLFVPPLRGEKSDGAIFRRFRGGGGGGGAGLFCRAGLAAGGCSVAVRMPLPEKRLDAVQSSAGS